MMTSPNNSAVTAPPAAGFAGRYRTLGNAPDEMIESDGSLRAHWRMFVSMLDDLGPQEQSRRWDFARRLIRDNGITHNVYGNPSGLDRPWDLNFVPLLIPQSEWDRIDVALSQRARLLDCLLADLYGPATTIAAGVLPPELVWANPMFLRPCHGIDLPQQRHLHLYAADIVRTASGAFEVLADRTQAPSGAGYTLENRIVLSRAIPTIFRQCSVQRLAPYFIAMRDTLTRLASPSRDNPRVVLLTPGPYNETYFEHAYLARYLGYTLVQGNDLTVRDAKVYLKTLGGLQRVDVILRRVDDNYCDPLELYARSYLGVPGLLEAVREKNVAVANALGSGLMQGPVFMPFLPALCRHLLGEELKMPSVRTWWCGDTDSRRYVLDNLRRFIIKPAFPHRDTQPTFCDLLTREQRGELASRIADRPEAFVAQDYALGYTAPSLRESTIEPQRFVLRSYLTASVDGYVTMSGGLTRVTESPDSLVVSMQQGGGSKDTWVLSDTPVSQVSLLSPAAQLVELSRGGGDLPSRIADDLFWLGRYVQRAEATTRVARAALIRSIEQGTYNGGRAMAVLAKLLLGRQADAASAQLDRDVVAGLFDEKRSESLIRIVGAIHRLARSLRDRISLDAWQILQRIDRDMTTFTISSSEPAAGVGELLDSIVSGFAAFVGLTTDSMSRGQAWRFLDMGLRLERGNATARLLRAALVSAQPDDMPLLEAVLEITDSALTYRRRYHTHLQAHAVADLLMADQCNPRAIAFQAQALHDHLLNLPRDAHHPRQAAERQTAAKLRATLEFADLERACRTTNGRRTRLEMLLNDVLDQLGHVSESISQVYFAHTAPPRRLTLPGEEPAL